MGHVIPYTLTAILALVLAMIYLRWRNAARAEFIRQFTFPKGLFDKLQKKRPGLSLKDCQLVALALRRFFLAYLNANRKPISMPSQAADDLWHEFILYTKSYDAFCNRAFGRFMHHTPAAVLSNIRDHDTGLRRCWWHACREESINPRKPTRLPLLFALDSKLNITDGFQYALDCNLMQRKTADGTAVYCGGDFVSTSDGGTGCSSGGDFSFDASGCSGGDSGGGCSGGCGGGD
jgi:hypothetical protein